jgi:cell division septal protein FtsQ
VVAGLKVGSHFPHRLTVQVLERVPVATVLVGGRSTAVSADGMLLHDVNPSATLPVIAVHLQAGGSRVTQPQVLQEVSLLGAAPNRLIANLSQVSLDPTHGLTVQLRSGPMIYFGDAGELSSKWIAATEVLADPGSSGASYIDVTDPQRPAAGTGSDPAGSSSSSSGTGASPATGSTAAAPGAATSPAATGTGTLTSGTTTGG